MAQARRASAAGRPEADPAEQGAAQGEGRARAQGESTGRSSRAARAQKKSGGDLGGRGRRHGREQRLMIIELIDEAVASGARFTKACHVVGLAPTTIARWRATPDADDARHGPITKPSNALTDAEECEALAMMNAPEHSSMSPDKLVPYLANFGIYLASQATLYRILRRRKLLRCRGRARRRSHRRPREHVATRPNQVWAWDITYLPTVVRGSFVKLYVVLDVWSRLIVGAEVHEFEDDAIAAKLIERCCAEQGVKPKELVLHSDNGGAMKGSTMLAKLQQLGVMPSFSRPHVSNDNAFAESVMRTVKYDPSYPDGPFADLAAARAWVATFVAWYNDEHLHSGISFVTPAQRHHGHDIAILEHRKATYAAARARRPDRWTGKTRCWDRHAVVRLNPQTSTPKSVN
ncbi:MAG: IS3 family transposase [Deltaproteobacteria bacterium]|nr:IS3 family transposase [Nannocystaceae bacterium]